MKGATLKSRVKIDKRAVKSVVEDAFRAKAFSGDLDYECPDCGRKIVITGPENVCECGFVLKVDLGPVEL